MRLTLTEAIEHQEKRVASPFVRANEKSRAAMQMGIDAMKRVKECGHPARCGLLERLPGETAE